MLGACTPQRKRRRLHHCGCDCEWLTVTGECRPFSRLSNSTTSSIHALEPHYLHSPASALFGNVLFPDFHFRCFARKSRIRSGEREHTAAAREPSTSLCLSAPFCSLCPLPPLHAAHTHPNDPASSLSLQPWSHSNAHNTRAHSRLSTGSQSPLLCPTPDSPRLDWLDVREFIITPLSPRRPPSYVFSLGASLRFHRRMRMCVRRG